MIDITDVAAAALLRGNQRRYVRIESWLDDELLDDDVPVATGSLDVDRGSNVPERLTFSVPRYDRGVDYTPVGELSPLAAAGQRLRLQVGVGLQAGFTEWLQIGWFVLTDAEPRGEQIDVQAAGLLWLIDEARLVNPLQPSGTIVSTVRQIIEPALTVVVDPGLTDRSVPSTVNYDQDRLGALNATLDAWPASAEVTNEGYLSVVPAGDPAVSVLTLTDGDGGTVVQARGTSSRTGVYNAVVAEGQSSDGQVVRGVAYDGTTPTRYGGPFSPLPVPFFFDSPLLTTQAQAQAAAVTRLITLLRSSSQTFDVEMVPHPALEAGDRITLSTELYGTFDAVVETLKLPLTADGGAELLTVRKLS